MMDGPLLRDSLGWGAALWLIGYAMGVVLFFVLPPAAIGWVITQIAVVITSWVLLRKVQVGGVRRDLMVAIAWTLIAVVLDYLFIVRLLAPVDGYYKADVYLYYALTLLMPPAIGWWKRARR